ncbi:acetylglutamate kinase [Maribacter hydrothermalis]|uniref:Acetylglutamate kinase n=1 Tax=Maribacter hydrothermalis TaxID=1836467 RepID=A0A1B7Z4X0_9FLAO|nr:acetylglutamate kinase [Maribacter hydrothermalis]APQ19268.1 acetylglutamate kinase [Maribacter hydrothermalis]OBR37600.1 acetylglutamate kinase [Maribacter hydrothermalis]
MKEKLSIVKIGGNVIEDEKALAIFLTAFSKLEGLKILVHGGGKLATQLATKLGVESKMIDGRRITDAETVDIITMVYGGLANKKIVAQLQAKKINAIGLSGADGNSIQAHKRPVKEIDYGFVGDIDGVNSELLSNLLSINLTPIFCAISHDGDGQLLNTNADTIASEIAIGMASLYKTTLYYCFEKKGVLLDITDDNSVVKNINTTKYNELLSEGVIADGMLPKLHNSFHALNNTVEKVCLGDVTMLDKNTEFFTTLTL